MKNKNYGFVEKNINEMQDEKVETVAEAPKEEVEKIEAQPIPVSAPTPKANTESSKKGFLIRTKTALNVRKFGDMKAPAVLVVGADTIHRIFEEKNGWGKIGDKKWINISPEYVERI